MKDIPVFTTEFGVASLTLREIPYQGAAYIRLQDSREPERLLSECVTFCRMAGSEEIYAAGDPCLTTRPFHTAIWQMTCPREALEPGDGALFPVTEATADRFQALYNGKIPKIPNAAWMDGNDKARMLRDAEGYFVHDRGRLLGIGRVSGEELRFLAALEPGAGERVLRTLAGALTGDRCVLEVASENTKAVALYQRLGFVKVRELSRWYRVL